MDWSLPRIHRSKTVHAMDTRLDEQDHILQEELSLSGEGNVQLGPLARMGDN
jgi:hypothetical protein